VCSLSLCGSHHLSLRPAGTSCQQVSDVDVHRSTQPKIRFILHENRVEFVNLDRARRAVCPADDSYCSTSPCMFGINKLSSGRSEQKL
jgi:hypothetical protein